MLTIAGYQITCLAEIPWEDRVNVDGWPSRAGMYFDDRENELCMRLIDYPVGSTEPRHVHAGSHATTVLKGRAIVDGLTLGPLDVVLLRALRFAPGAQIAKPARAPFAAALVVEGDAVIEDETLGAWDFIRVQGGAEHAPIRFPRGATLLAVTLR